MRWLLLIPFLFLLGCAATPLESQIHVRMDSGAVFDVEVADTPAERSEGLMFREHLGESEGMWFVFENAYSYQFWMKDTLIPMDIIFVGEDMRVVDIIKADPCTAEPCKRYAPAAPARYVLEVNQNSSDRKGIRKGDAVSFG